MCHGYGATPLSRIVICDASIGNRIAQMLLHHFSVGNRGRSMQLFHWRETREPAGRRRHAGMKMARFDCRLLRKSLARAECAPTDQALLRTLAPRSPQQCVRSVRTRWCATARALRHGRRCGRSSWEIRTVEEVTNRPLRRVAAEVSFFRARDHQDAAVARFRAATVPRAAAAGVEVWVTRG